MSAGRRGTALALAALWPAGAVLAVAHQELDQVTTPRFLLLAAAYVAAAGALLVRHGAHRSGPLGVMAAAPVALFTVGGWTGAPTGAEPDLLVVNTAVLLVVALALALSASHLVLRHRCSAVAGPAAVTIVLLLLGTAGYLLNLLGRFAVVLTGLAEQQAAVEDRYWMAAEYLRGLPANAEPLAYLLTWMDLVQLGYVATGYVAAAGLARLLCAEGVVSPWTGRVVERCGWAAAGLLVGAATLAAALPRDLDAAPAGLAFALSIPFMSTLLPFALAVGALSSAASPPQPSSVPTSAAVR